MLPVITFISQRLCLLAGVFAGTRIFESEMPPDHH